MKGARVALLYTGGTIGMKETPRGFAPARGHLAQQLARMPDLGQAVPYELVEWDPLLDSSNIDMDDWVRIAKDVGARYEDFDAFVVLHGTDTMAYTASALSFLLEDLGKPVILTGSQIPLERLRTDAVGNLLGALLLAGGYAIPEVGLYFHDTLLRGNRAQKVDATGFDAFRSGNYPPLAEVGTEIRVRARAVRPKPTTPLCVHEAMDPNVASLRLFPGITRDIVENFLRPPIRGVVLETYGTGNAPDQREDFLRALRDASDRGVVLVNCTQCLHGAVTREYAAGTALADSGVVGGADMTAEAALAKLSFLLGSGLSPDDVRAQIPRDLRGELTASPE